MGARKAVGSLAVTLAGRDVFNAFPTRDVFETFAKRDVLRALSDGAVYILCDDQTDVDERSVPVARSDRAPCRSGAVPTAVALYLTTIETPGRMQAKVADPASYAFMTVSDFAIGGCIQTFTAKLSTCRLSRKIRTKSERHPQPSTASFHQRVELLRRPTDKSETHTS